MPTLPKRNPARRNRTTTKATLVADPSVTAPPLPAREAGWTQQAVDFWADIWASPMAPEYHESDIHGLYVLIGLVDAYWTAGNPTAQVKFAAEIRQQRQCFGLTPIDRRRLQWEIARGDEADEKTTSRRAAKASSAKAPTAAADPRRVLGAVA
jgi:hypothetical protein